MAEQVVVETRDGRVAGARDGGVARFLGIPYARARRWAAPERPQPWTQTREATRFGPCSPQPDGFLAMLPPGIEQSEDCLSLNVFTPDPAGARPVLVWVHGGAFRSGAAASPLYDGSALARRGDVVVVTLNYRLGALGFLAHPDLREHDGAPAGNWGLLDTVAALQWVADNAAAFGGDPANVTLFGESAGSMAVGTLLAAPATRGLVRRAILQSGAPSAARFDDAAELAERLAKQAGLGSVAELRRLPVDALLAAQVELDADDANLKFIPSVDGHLLDRAPLTALQEGAAAGVATIVGTNRDEWKLWAPADPRSRDLDRDALRRRLSARLTGDVDEVIDVIARERAAAGERAEPNDVWFAAETERVFRVPAVRTAQALAAHAPVHVYLFTYRSPAMGGWLGACHALEIPFVFGTHRSAGMGSWTGSGPVADQLSDWLMEHWLAFARDGDPGGGWLSYDTATRPTLVVGAERELVAAPFDAERRVVEEHLPR